MKRFALVLALVAFAAGCSSGTTLKLIVSANDAQQAAADTYNAAKAAEDGAAQACRQVLVSKGQPLPATPEQIQPACTAIGQPLPYDPVKLQKAAAPINALYDGIRAANAARTASGTAEDIGLVVSTQLGSLFAAVVADLTAAGVAVPSSVAQTAALLVKGGP